MQVIDCEAAGNRAQMVDSTGTTTWAYNARNQVTSESKGGVSITYSYDEASRLSSQTDQANVTTSYSYDAAGRLASVTAAGKTTTYGYDANSNLTSQSNPNGTTVTQTFNAADELTSLVHKKSDATTLSQFSYSYNSDGLRSQVNETLGSQTATVTYTYDALHRLKDEVRTGTDAYENHFTYDAAGNRLTWNDGFGTTTYTYDAADRLIQEGSNTTYTYNANGSRVSKTTNGSTTTYSYDFDEQLTQVVSPTTGTSSFTYDGLGRRVTRTHGGVTTTFHFSGNRVTTETQGANIVAHYVYGVNRVSRDASGSYEYYHADGLGSTRQLSNDSQSVTQTTTYDAFGNIESSAGTSNNAYGYGGPEDCRSDGDDGLIFIGAGYYDPSVGGYMSRGAQQHPQQPIHLYDSQGNYIGPMILPPGVTVGPPPKPVLQVPPFVLPWPGLGGTPPKSGPSSPPKPKPSLIVGGTISYPGPPLPPIGIAPWQTQFSLTYTQGPLSVGIRTTNPAFGFGGQGIAQTQVFFSYNVLPWLEKIFK